ncbi:hypothetical protein ACFLSG_01525 [Candidatus Bipolaricaulota bacterium]
MKRRLTHPLWTHLPAAAALCGFVLWFLLRIRIWPDRIPLQVNFSGEPTTWGSPWIAFGVVVALGIFFLFLTVLLDELWARQESHKRFNFLSLLDELVVALLVTIQVAFLQAATDGATVYRVPLGWLVAGVGGILLLGVLVELKRPFIATEEAPRLQPHGLDGFRENLRTRIAAGETVVYWDIQNPRYVTWLSIGVPLLLWVAAGFLVQTSAWAASLEAFVGVVLLQFYGGQRTRVTREGITIRYGLMGIRIFRCRLNEISGIRVRTFAPLADFGGYGIRVAKGITAYYLAGRTGVQLDLMDRRATLIGSANPQRLASVVEALSGIAAESESEVQL